MSPNLFKYATSELSQDAVLCLLLSWADAQYAKNPLHTVGKELLRLIYVRAGLELPEFTSIAVGKQKGHIDILCVVNKETVIVIEGRVGTKQHLGQLDKYRVHVTTELGYTPGNMILVYIQTGDPSDDGDVLKSGYMLISRADLLGIFESEEEEAAKIQSDILSDFSAHLRRIEDAVQSYRTTPPSQWPWEAWKGFYSRLKAELGDGHWDYVANPSGGFLGFWWHFQGDDDFNVYLQLEEQKLCFKIWVKDTQRRGDLREYWHEKIMAADKSIGLLLKRPNRFGSGEYMTVALLASDYRVTSADGLLDMEKTLGLLSSAQAVIDECTEKLGRGDLTTNSIDFIINLRQPERMS